MITKKLLGALLMLICSIGSLWAADPFVGTWKLNVPKSKFAKGREVKELTLTTVEQGDNVMVTVIGTSGEGKPVSVKYTVPAKGGSLNYTEGAPPAGTTVVAKRVDANTVDFTVTMNGKQVAIDHCVLSADGKTLTNNRNSIDASGNAAKWTEVFNRQ